MAAHGLVRHAVTAALCLLTCVSLAVAQQPPGTRGDLDLTPQMPAALDGPTPPYFQSMASDSFGLCLDTSYSFGSFGGTDCWGWKAPDGTEYAFMGTSLGVVIVNTATRKVCDTIIGPASSCGTAMWRDLKTYRHYLYAASECSGTRAGIMIIDLSTLPDSAHFLKSYVSGTQVTCHNISVDTARGYLYAVRSGYDGFRVISLADPENPVELPFVATGDMHDMIGLNDTVYAAEGNRHTFSIYDMANKNVPVLLTRIAIPSGGYVHNIWPTADRHYVATTEETANHTIKLWDISDLNNVQLVSQFLAPSNLAHNAHVEGNKIFVSHYESGGVAFDISNPAAPRLLAQFDTYPSETANFNGDWGIYPHTSNGKVYVSNMNGGFYILKKTEVTTSGNTISTDTVSGIPNTNVTITINVVNTQPVRTLTIPVDFSGPLNMTFVSISRVGTRTAGFQSDGYLALNPTHTAFVYTTTSSSNGTAPDMPPGSGPVLKIIARIPAGATGGPNPISVGPVLGFDAQLTTDCVNYTISELGGAVKLYAPNGCCVGVVGNVDSDPGQSVDIADLTALIDHLFVTFSPLGCSDEANIDGSSNGNVDIGDLTALIDNLFISFTPLHSCP